MSVLRRYRKERGGKIQWIICPTAPVEPDMAKYREHVEALIKDGCEAIYLWGVHADSLVAQGKMDLVAKAVELPKEFGVPSGVGAHSLDVVKACEKHGVKADFYIKTFHHHSYPTAPKAGARSRPYNEFPGYWCANPQETAEVMKTVKKPWIAFKTMAAGRHSAARTPSATPSTTARTSCWPACSTSRSPRTSSWRLKPCAEHRNASGRGKGDP